MKVIWKWKCYGLQGKITGNGTGIGNAMEKLRSKLNEMKSRQEMEKSQLKIKMEK